MLVENLGLWSVDEKQEIQMDRQLREVLKEERVRAHQFPKDNGPLEDVDCVVDTEGIKNRGQQHILAN